MNIGLRITAAGLCRNLTCFPYTECTAKLLQIFHMCKKNEKFLQNKRRNLKFLRLLVILLSCQFFQTLGTEAFGRVVLRDMAAGCVAEDNPCTLALSGVIGLTKELRTATRTSLVSHIFQLLTFTTIIPHANHERGRFRWKSHRSNHILDSRPYIRAQSLYKVDQRPFLDRLPPMQYPWHRVVWYQ